jgi:AraC-like DNA-binding protein
MQKEINLPTYNTQEVLKTLARAFKTTIHHDQAEHRIKIPASYGEGYIAGIDFKDGLEMLIFNCSFKKDIILKYATTNFQPLRLIFCMENDFMHIIKEDRLQYQLNHLLGSMVSGTCNNEQIFLLPADKKIYYYSIEIDRKKYLPKIEDALKNLPGELSEILADGDCTRSFLYQSHYSLTIAECIQKINESEHTGLVRRVFLESKTLEILAMQIKQYLDDLSPSKRQSILRKKDIEQIIAAKNLLLENLQGHLTIRELARLTGTNENKLKMGFKQVYNTSIYKILQNEKLEAAKLLLVEEKYSIKEIATKVGYKHVGHFSSKFKKKFGILPKDYLKSLDIKS